MNDEADHALTLAALGMVLANGEQVKAALKVLFDNLPDGELPRGEDYMLALDEKNERLVIRRGADLYWLAENCTVRLRAGQLTYFRRGRAFDAPPAFEN